MIFGQLFGPHQVLEIFGFSNFYFVGLGWFVVLFLVSSLCYSGHNFVKNWGSLPPQSYFMFFCLHIISHVQLDVHNCYAYLQVIMTLITSKCISDNEPKKIMNA